jgi:6-phosphofructokinase 1
MQIDPDDPETARREWTMPLTRDSVRTIDRTGGTILHTSRINPAKVGPKEVPASVRAEDRVAAPDGAVDCTRHVLRVLEWLGLEAIIPIGGDDTLSYAARLHREGLRVVGIPKTMDNDVFGTDYCIGFSTAVTRSVDAITALRSSVGSHERIGVVELFGRNSGETSLVTAYLADVDRAIISEVPFDLDRLAAFLVEDRKRNPSQYAILTVSEGAHPKGGTVLETGEADAYGHKKLGGMGALVAEEIKKRTGVNIMYQQLAYIMRSGAPDSLDRMVAVSYGNLALDQVVMGHTGRMVALQQGIYTTVPLDLVLASKKRVDVTALYDEGTYRPKVRDMLGKPMFLY